MEKSIGELLNFGIIVIDKPAGPTSFSVSDYVRKKLGINKTSHFGTLDPQVTGVLPVALGRACKLTGTFLGHDKTYIGIMHTHKEQNMKDLQKIINENFLGTIKQTPPKKSRVKRQERERDIMRFELIEASDDNKDFLFISEVQGGTYIRKLCSDLGEKIGGAHMLELRRTRASIFDESKIVKLYDLDKAIENHENGNSEDLKKLIIPAEIAIREVLMPYEAKEESVKQLKTGRPIHKNDIEGLSPQEGDFAVFYKDAFIGLYKLTNESIEIIARPSFVFT